MFNFYLTEEEVKKQVEDFMAESFGKMFEDEITVYRITPQDSYDDNDYIFMNSKNMPGYRITLVRGKKSEDIKCDYMQVFYREKFIRPSLKNKMDELLGDNLLLVDLAYRPKEINYELTLDRFMNETGVSFDVMIKQSDFEKNGAKFYEEKIMEFINEAKEKNWYYPVITVWVCKDLPSGEVRHMQEFDKLWNKSDKCKKISHQTFYTKDDFSVEINPWH